MTLMNMSIAGAVMILVVILIRALLIDKLPKRTFIILWMIVIARLLIPVEIASKTSVYNLRPELMTSPSTLSETKEVPTVVEETEVNYEVPVVEGRSLTNQIESVQIEEPVKTFKLNANHIWLIGAVLLSIYFARTYSKSKKILNTSIPCDDDRIINYVKSNSDRNIDIRWLDRINTAITYGIFKSIIVLPKRLEYADDETIEKILLHEHYHIESYDSIKKLLMMVTLIVHWFNPLVWIMYIIFNRDMELYCDERVLIHLGRDERADYAYTLIEQSDRDNTFSLNSGFSKNALEERVRSVMKYKKSTVITIGLAVVVLIGVVVFFATSKSDKGAVGEDFTFDTFAGSIDNGDNNFNFMVSHGAVKKAPVQYIETDVDQEVEIDYRFSNSADTTVSIENSNGEVEVIANSQEPNEKKTIKLTKGMNTMYIESTGQVGSFSLIGTVSNPDGLLYVGSLDKEEYYKVQLRDFDEEIYKSFGLELDKVDSKLYYNGKTVRRFYDLIEENKTDERLHSGIAIDFFDRRGEINLFAIRENGELIRLVEVEDIDEFKWMTYPSIIKGEVDINNSSREEQLTMYRNYGLVYNGEKNVLDYLGVRVKEFTDIRKTPTNDVENCEYSDDKGEVYVYTVRDNSRVGVNGLGGLVDMRSTDNEAEYRKALKKAVEEPYSYYKDSFNERIPDDYDEIIKDMNITIDSATFTSDRDEDNQSSPSYLIELKYHYVEQKDLSQVELGVIQLGHNGDSYLKEYFFEDKTDKEIAVDGIIYRTKYFETTKGFGNLLLNFNLRRDNEYVGYYSVETPIGNSTDEVELSTKTSSGNIKVEEKKIDLNAFYSEYRPHGLEYRAEEGRLYYLGKKVKEFYDVRKTADMTEIIAPKSDKGEVYVYAARDNTNIDKYGNGKLVYLIFTEKESEFKDEIKKKQEDPFWYYKTSRDDTKEEYERIVNHMDFKLDSIKLTDKREEMNLSKPKYVVEVKYHYIEHDDIKNVYSSAHLQSLSYTGMLKKYTFSSPNKPVKTGNTIYVTDYFELDSPSGEITLTMTFSEDRGYYGYFSLHGPIEKSSSQIK